MRIGAAVSSASLARVASLILVASLAAVSATACTADRLTPSDASPPTDGSGVPPFRPTLGAHWDPTGNGVAFRVASTRATRLELDLFDQPTGAAPVQTITMDRDSDTTFVAHVAASALPATIYYGYRAWGPNWPYDPAWTPGSTAGWITDVDAAGNRMNPNKLVFDPYALELSHDPQTPAQADGTPYATGAHRDLDSASVAPKGIVLHEDAADVGAHPTRPLRDDVIYEVHLRGLTNAAGGTCAGTYVAAAARAEDLHELGITAIELMPLAETQNDRNDVDPASASGDNYWGYSTLAYFAPDRRYACDRSPGGPTRELRAMVKAFHDREIKVLVDVVYNHTAEGGGSALLSLRGLDNAGYYQLDAAGTGFTNSNGVGADVAAQKPLAQGLILDSLHYWHEALGFDGFRFDLAPVLGNATAGGFHFDPTALPQTIAQQFPDAALIAEPWAVVANSYEVGRFPAGWSEWNDTFRDTVREDQNENGTTAITPGLLATRIAGSKDIYASRAPSAGITYLVSHDGFTLHDLYACDASANAQPWPYGPSTGGSTTNHSWAHDGDPVAQRQATRTGLALELLSAGVPMIEGGDEVAHGVRCNNNPYDLDSPATWIDDTPATDPLWTFTQRLLAFRAAHPALRPNGWFAPTWLDDTGHVASGAYLGDATRPILAWKASSDPIYVAYNRGPTKVTVTLPAAPAGLAWYRAANTAAFLEPSANFTLPGQEAPVQATYDLDGRALAILIAR
ncbi:MAG: alpha-amylase family glycosyl hydrolase [Kofleriaceae bacterium]